MTGVFNPFSQEMAKPSLVAYIHSRISGYSPGRSFDTIHASDVTKPSFCARRRALQYMERDKPKDEFLTTCQAKVYEEGRMYEEVVRAKWCKDLAVGNWECGWCGGFHTLTRHPDTCHHCRRPAPMRYHEVRFTSRANGVSCGVDTFMLLPGFSKLTLVEIKTIASSSTQKDTPTFAKLVAPLAEHHSRSSWYLKLIEDSGDPLAQFIDLTQALILYISKGYGETMPELALLGIMDKMSAFKEYWVPRNDVLGQVYDDKAQPLGEFYRRGLMPCRICSSRDDPLAKKCPKADSCFSSVYPEGKLIQTWGLR